MTTPKANLLALAERGSCKSCLGTGWLLCLNSWFLGDGFRRERCGICAGSGQYRGPNYHPEQRRFRAQQAAMNAAPKELNYVQLGKIAREAASQ